MAMLKLSETLTHPREPGRCQACGGPSTIVWTEHDDDDKPTLTHVLLCGRCSDQLIEVHPRLYAAADRHAPIPGVLAICFDCDHRVGLVCGGAATLATPVPAMCRVCMRGRHGRRSGKWVKLWPHEPRSCGGKAVRSCVA
jgi:hypothetical protein